MAYGDYLPCSECDCKLIYDGDRNLRDWLEERYGDPSASDYTVNMVCPDCLNKIRDELEQCKKDRMLLHSVVEERVKRTGDCWDQLEAAKQAHSEKQDMCLDCERELLACQKDTDTWCQKAIELGLEASELGKQRDELLDAAIMAVEMIETNAHERRHVRFKLKDAIAKVGKETK